MITFLRNKSYQEKLAQINLFSVEKRQLRGEIIECFKILKGFTNLDAVMLFSTDNTLRTKNITIKLRCKQVLLDNTKCYLTNDVVRLWNKFPHSVVYYELFDCRLR